MKAFHGQPSLGKLAGEGSGDGLGGAIGDEGHFLRGINAEAGGDGRAGAGHELGRIGQGKKMRGGFGHASGWVLPSKNPANLRGLL